MFVLGPQSNTINAIHRRFCDNSLFTLIKQQKKTKQKKTKKKKKKKHKMNLQGLELITRPLETFAYFSYAPPLYSLR